MDERSAISSQLVSGMGGHLRRTGVALFITDSGMMQAATWLRRSMLPPGRRSIGELACMFLVFLVVEYVVFGRGTLANIQPHPFWFPVILLAAQYGTSSGLTAAVAAIVLSWIVGWSPQQFGEDFFSYSIRIWHQPILWLCTAILLGELRNRHIAERTTLAEQFAEANAQRQSIADFCTQLRNNNEALSREIACARDQSVDAALTALTALRNAAADKLSRTLAVAVETLIGQSQYAVLVPVEGGEWAAVAHEEPPSRATPTHRHLPPAVQETIMRDRRSLSVLRPDDADLLDGIGLMAMPIISADGTALGVLLLDSIDADRLREETETALQMICNELSHTINASSHSSTLTRLDNVA
jgi:polysaccharide biosynthesis protein PelD